MKIVELVCKPTGNAIVPQVFTVGRAPINAVGTAMEDMGIVERITHNRQCDVYNKGYQGEFPTYMVKFVDSDIRMLIPQSEMSRFSIDVEKGQKDQKDDEAVPDLPD